MRPGHALAPGNCMGPQQRQLHSGPQHTGMHGALRGDAWLLRVQAFAMHETCMHRVTQLMGRVACPLACACLAGTMSCHYCSSS